MATREQIELVLERIEKTRPEDFFKSVDNAQKGIAAVLRLLSESGEPVTAGTISEALNVSTARVAVLLKKMAGKNLITREKSPEDGRITVVKLTGQGQKTASEMGAAFYAQAGRIIDAVGEARIMVFLAIADEIRAVLEKPNFDF